MSVGSLGMTLKPRDSIEFHASRSEATAWLAIRIDDTQCEIRMERSHVESLRDQIPVVLKGIDSAAVEDLACDRAEAAAERAADLADRALETARLVEEAGAADLAASLRAAVAEAARTAGAIDQAVRGFVEATLYADLAVDRLVCAVWKAESEVLPATGTE